jgi:uncharacterized protein (DUF362 family)
MKQTTVAVVRYEKPLESVRKAVELSGGLDRLPAGARVFIKPNIVFWTRATDFPKWGCITTSRVVEDMVVLLKERGIDRITVGEGMVVADPKDIETPAHAFESLGYRKLEARYGVRCCNVMERPFKKVDLGDGFELKFSAEALDSDFVVNLPTLKTHNQTFVSLGIKNLKGLIDIPSRKKCHTMEPGRDLHHHVARLADRMPPLFTLIDGIYSLEKGPAFDGRIRRSNLLVASADFLSADLVGCRVLGHDPAAVPHLAIAAANQGRPADLSGIDVKGETVESVASYHDHDFPYTVDDGRSVPVPLAKDGLQGIFYRKYDLSMCTYCSGINGIILTAIRYAWKGEPWDQVEVLTGKSVKPTPGMNKTILLGKCIIQANQDHPDIREGIPIRGCPPRIDDIVRALHQAGIDANPEMFKNLDKLPGYLLQRYAGKPEYDASFHRVA